MHDTSRHYAGRSDNAGPHGVSMTLTGIHKRFGPREVIRGIDLHVRAGEFVAIVGRSGCGKSTLLRMLAGLDDPDEGSLALDDRPLAQMRQAIRIMFQDARLLPWKSALDNVALGLGGGRSARRAHALDALSHVGLADRAAEWPTRLSGGQRQRVALVRALVHRPRLLLLDESLGALDALTRIEMHALIERLWHEEGFTALLVTHDVGEAVALADRILVVEDGVVAEDIAVPIPRPRRAAHATAAALEAQILRRVLQHPGTPPPTTHILPFERWHWAA